MHLFHPSRAIALILSALLFGIALSACNSTTGGGGINSAPGITDRFQPVTVSDPGVIKATASCQAGEQMVGGGWALNPTAYKQDTVSRGGITHNVIDEYFIAASYPSSPNSWTVTFTNQSAGDAGGNLLAFVHVECLTKGQTPQIVTANSDRNTGSDLRVNCPAGTHVTSGGYQMDNLSEANLASGVIDFVRSNPISNLGWDVGTDYSIGQLNAFGSNVTVYALCNSNLQVSAGTTGTAVAPSSNLSQAATTGIGDATCPAGQTPMGAGYVKGGHFSPRAFPITSFYPSYGTTNPQWGATAFALPPIVFDGPDTSTGGTLTISPLCAPIPA